MNYDNNSDDNSAIVCLITVAMYFLLMLHLAFFSVNFCFNCIKLDNSNRLFNYCSCVFPVNVAFRFLFFLLNFVLTAYN